MSVPKIDPELFITRLEKLYTSWEVMPKGCGWASIRVLFYANARMKEKVCGAMQTLWLLHWARMR